jgi:agmatinase
MNQSFPPSPFSLPKGGWPFAGIATFAGYPLWQAERKVDAVFLGVPYDEGTTYRPGARFGPRAVRDASMLYSYQPQEERFYDADRRKWVLAGKVIADAGDVEIEPVNLQKNWSSITRAVSSILQAGAVPAVVGGDHSITHPVLAAFEGKEFHYIHFDTHLDCDLSENRRTHGSPVVHVIESGLARSTTLLGVRGLVNSYEEFTWLEERGAAIITARELRAQLQQQSVSPRFKAGDYYLSVDIDFFDPSVAPGTGTIEPGGLFFHEFSDIIHMIAEAGTIIGFDVVEVSPMLGGQSAITEHLAARCVLELLSAALD